MLAKYEVSHKIDQSKLSKIETAELHRKNNVTQIDSALRKDNSTQTKIKTVELHCKYNVTSKMKTDKLQSKDDVKSKIETATLLRKINATQMKIVKANIWDHLWDNPILKLLRLHNITHSRYRTAWMYGIKLTTKEISGGAIDFVTKGKIFSLIKRLF
ncbi:jg20460 [Pararge aegeria aegeria]|uniref:Jg20460 protein n=1 Tax=Pararge aegeria aegeria TaxID=348720 RepID=A0A8S4QTB7_9NEOP|nr:jg20460 [Pararge aegeria aegeria]